MSKRAQLVERVALSYERGVKDVPVFLVRNGLALHPVAYSGGIGYALSATSCGWRVATFETGGLAEKALLALERVADWTTYGAKDVPKTGKRISRIIIQHGGFAGADTIKKTRGPSRLPKEPRP